jgi:hypothetical protein
MMMMMMINETCCGGSRRHPADVLASGGLASVSGSNTVD